MDGGQARYSPDTASGRLIDNFLADFWPASVWPFSLVESSSNPSGRWCINSRTEDSLAVRRVIKGVHIVPMGFANAFLIEGDDGLTLIDAGYPNKEAAVFGAIRRLSRSPDQLKHLIFTHGHPDHIGSAAAIVRGTGARTYMHPLDISIAESGGPFRPMTPAPGLLGRVLCNLFFHPDERRGPGCDRPAFDPRGNTARRRWLRSNSCPRALRRTGRAAVASRTNAVRR